MNVMTLEAICWKEQNHTLEAAWVTETPHRKPPTKYQNWTPTCEKLIYIGFSHSNVDIYSEARISLTNSETNCAVTIPCKLEMWWYV